MISNTDLKLMKSKCGQTKRYGTRNTILRLSYCSSDEEISASLDDNFNCEEELDYSDDYENEQVTKCMIQMSVHRYL